MSPVRFELQNFYPRGKIFKFDNKYIIRCLLLKYRLIFLLVFLYLTSLKARQILSRLVKSISLYFKRRHLITSNYYHLSSRTVSNTLFASKHDHRMSHLIKFITARRKSQSNCYFKFLPAISLFCPLFHCFARYFNKNNKTTNQSDLGNNARHVITLEIVCRKR